MPKLVLEADVRTEYSQQGPREFSLNTQMKTVPGNLTATGAAQSCNSKPGGRRNFTSFALVSSASFALSAVAKLFPCDGGVYLSAPGYDGYGRSHEEDAFPLSGIGYGLSSPVTFTPIALIPRVCGWVASSGSVPRSSPSVSVKLLVCNSSPSRARNFMMEALPFPHRFFTMA